MRAPMVPRASKAMPGGSIGQAAMVEIPSWRGRIPLCGKQNQRAAGRVFFPLPL